jgi:hypothetical protein
VKPLVETIPITVHCRSSHKGDETPTSLTLEDRTLLVRRVVAEWLEESDGLRCHHFRLVTTCGATLVIARDLRSDLWRLVSSDSGFEPRHSL